MPHDEVVEYFSAIYIKDGSGEDVYHIRDADRSDVLRIINEIENGDILKISPLGKLIVDQVFHTPFRSGNYTYYEIAIYCSEV